MQKCIIISDSFKGSLSSKSICSIFKESTLKVFPNCKIIQIPIGDGGEGTLDAISSNINGKYITCLTKDPYFNDISAKYYLGEDNTAYVELASCAGLPLVTVKNPLLTTTYGVGLEIIDAIKNGAKRIILALGGSATVDGGCGAASALGVKFYNDKKEVFIPTGGTLNDIVSFDMSECTSLLKDIEIIFMCDVDNKMIGELGAAKVFGPQKGATPEMVNTLEQGLSHLNDLFISNLDINIGAINKTGTAGAFAAGGLAFMHAKLESGIEVMLNLVKFKDQLNDVDIVFTGEGKLDSQSIHGKVISGILSYTKPLNIPLVVIAGGVSSEAEDYLNQDVGFNAIITTNRLPLHYEELIPYSEEFYKHTIINIMSLIKLGETIK